MKPTSKPNLLLITGAGQNTGKTTLAEMIIRSFTISHSIAAIKVSPHRHQGFLSHPLWESGRSRIIIERNLSHKDSSRFLQAGADPVFYIETTDTEAETTLELAFRHAGADRLIVCESGLVARRFKPGLLVFTERLHAELTPEKMAVKGIADAVITAGNERELQEAINGLIGKIIIVNNTWVLAR